MSSEAVLMATTTDESIKSKVSMVSLRVDAEVRDLVSEVTITQVFRNDLPAAIEATYCFPIEEGAAVHGFRIETGGRTLEGVIEDRDEAFDLYDKAIGDGDAAYLLDQETEDILTVSVGNVASGQEVKVALSYVSELVVYDGTARFHIPTTVSPRYPLPGTTPEDADRISPPIAESVPYAMELEVSIGSRWADSVTSPSHPIEVQERSETTVVRPVGGSIVPDQDFVLEIKLANVGEPVCLIGTDENGNTAGVVRFYPDGDTPQSSLKSEVLFAIDCSGSMDGSSIEEAKHALELCLRSLQTDDMFNIIRFGSSHELYSPESVRYDTASFNKAIKFVRRMRADLGGTELQGAISYACGLPAREGYQRDLVLITDGEVSDPDSVIRIVSEARGRQRVFSFGIGYGASSHLVKGVARQSNGAYEMIHPGEKLQPKVLRQMSRMAHPILTEIGLEFEGIEANPLNYLPPVFDGDSWTTYFGVPESNASGQKPTVTLSAGRGGKEFSMSAPVIDVGRNNAIAPLWALATIRDLKHSPGTGSAQSSRREERNKSRIIEIAKRHNLLSDYTSFVAVEKRPDSERNSGSPAFQRVPVLLTRDWHGSGGSALPGMAAPASAPVSATAASGSGAISSMMGAVAAAEAPARLFSRSLFGGGRKKSSSRRSGRRPAALNSMDASIPGGKEDASFWYLDLLSTQHPEGFFEGIAIVAKVLEIPEKKMRSLTGLLSTGLTAAGINVLTTWLAIRLLRSDAEALDSSLRAIRKAEKWLEEAGCTKKDARGELMIPTEGASIETLLRVEWPDACARLGIDEEV